MDPITGAVIAMLVWFFAAGPGYVLIFWVCTLIGVSIDEDTGGVVGAGCGWILGLVWAVFAIVQSALQFAHLLQIT